MTVWFEGESGIDCDIKDLKTAVDDLGSLFVGVVSHMPGMADVELVDASGDTVIISTNEGSMKRTNISRQVGGESVVVEFDEEYEAGSRMTTTSHVRHEFTATDHGVDHQLVMSDVEASGLLGFFYRTFGKANTGNAFLTAFKDQLEAKPG